MGYKELVNIDELDADLDSFALKRIPYVQKLVDDFKTFYEEKYLLKISTIEDIAAHISYLYFAMCYRHVKPAIDDKANKYKMASLMELVIVQKQALIHPSDNIIKNRELNAIFGMTAAFSMINCMITEANKDFFCDTLNAGLNTRIDQVCEDHKLWLKTKELNEMPVFINAQFYELIEVIHSSSLQVHGY